MKQFLLFLVVVIVALLLPSFALAQEGDFKTDYTDPACMEAEMQYAMAGMTYDYIAEYRDNQWEKLAKLRAALAEADLSEEDAEAAQDYLDAAEGDLIVFDMWLGLMFDSLIEADGDLGGATTAYNSEDYETAYMAALAAIGLSDSVGDNITEAGECSTSADENMEAAMVLLGLSEPPPPPPSMMQ